ncbi:MAG: glycoside hydrolase family 3 protein [Bacteroidales bacterium]|nr:glycoside hydrolase family 3 protein [Bacteroidales bacterium]
MCSEEILRKQIAQMLVVGFEGTEAGKESHIIRDIKEYGLGSVILFEFTGRNVASKEQLKTLCTNLQTAAQGDLLIAIDQEGGDVNRLKAKYGFTDFPSAAYLGSHSDEETSHWGAEMANTLAEMGINLNFAPCVDVDVNPASPAIGARGRSISANPEVVARKASLWIEEHSKRNIISCAKHFPGHGSALTDTHKGPADVTDTWQDYELYPYKYLIERGQIDMVMVAHVFNAHLDNENPASVSSKIINGLLREKLHFDGVVATDDLGMGALSNSLSYSDIVEKTINAGADLLCIANESSPYNPDIVPQTINLIFNKVKEGRIALERIEESAGRVAALKRRLNNNLIRR